MKLILISVALLFLTAPLHASDEQAQSPPDIVVRFERDTAASVGCSELTPPVVKIRVSPKYPKAAKKEHKRGSVVLAANISKEGKVGEVQVVKADDQMFVEPSILALRKSIIEPAKCDGKPIASIYNLVVNFK